MAGLMTSLISGVGGSLLSGLGGKSSQTANNNSSGTKNSTSTSSTNQLNQAIEDPAFAQFRQALLPMIMGLVDKAQQPIYTDSKIASTLAGINQQFNKQDINPALAGRGLLNSGLARTMRADVDNQRSSAASQFFSQIPALEQQAQFQNLSSALGLGAQFAGRAPISQQLTGTQNQTSNEQFNQTGQSTQSGGQGFGGAFANNLGGWLGATGGDFLKNLNNRDVKPSSPGYWGG